MYWPSMRDNLDAYLNGDAAKEAEGEWLIYRYFLKGQLTTNWSKVYDSSPGGSKFKYIEFPVRGIMEPTGMFYRSASNFENVQGIIEDHDHVAMINFDMKRIDINTYLKPQIGDSIFTISEGHRKGKPTEEHHKLERFKIISYYSSKATRGRPSGWLLNLKLDNSRS